MAGKTIHNSKQLSGKILWSVVSIHMKSTLKQQNQMESSHPKAKIVRHQA